MAKRKVYPSAKSKRAVSDDEREVLVPKRERRRDQVKYLKWWTAPSGKEAQSSLWQWVDRQRSTWSMDAINDLIAESVYSDSPLSAGGRIGEGGRYIGVHAGMNPINKVKSLVDTGTAHLVKVRSMPVISADDAEYAEKRFAREQSRVLRRKMGSGDMELVMPLVIRDFLIRGTAWGKIVRCSGDTEFRRVPSYEILYDHREALYGPVTHRAHVRPENRDTLAALYPKYRDAIMDAPSFTRVDPWMTYTYTGPNLADMVEVVEAWHPPSDADYDEDGDHDGQWIVAIRGTTICRAPWSCLRDPLHCVYWTPPTRGTGRGTGLVVEQAAAQSWVNDILHDARVAIRHGSQLKVFQPRGAGVNKQHLKATSPVVIEYDGAEPHYVAPDPVSKQAWDIAFQMLQQMDLTSGIPQWASGSTSPLGANPAAKALETMEDIHSERFASVESGLQQWRVAMGLRHIDAARMMHDEAHGKAGDRKFDEQPDPIEKDDLAAWIRDNTWPDVDIDGGDYHLTLEPENFIVGTRGGKLEQVQEAAKAGLIPDPSLAAAQFDEPDIQRANRGILGPVRRIEQCLSDLANLDVPYLDCAPDPEMNFALADLLALGEIEQAKADKADPAIIQRFRDFRNDVERQRKLKATNSAPSLPGAQANSIVAQPNAGTLSGGPPAGPAPSVPPPMPPGVS